MFGLSKRTISLAAAAVFALVSSTLSAQPVASSQIAPSQNPAYQCQASNGYAPDFAGRRTFLWRPQWLEAIAEDKDRRKGAITEAGKALKRGPYSVTDKGALVPGATAHDYTSIGPYWWPDRGKKDGLPYKRRDGEVNPERNGPNFDKNRLTQLGADMEALSVGYYLTGDDRFAQHAALLVRAWFLDPATRMSPNMDFAQGIPGRVNGRGEGIIEASDFSTVIEAVGLIAPSGALSDQEHQRLKSWFAQFAKWMATSENGAAEMRKTNNHGVFYDFYLAHFALFAGIDSVTANVARNFPEYRLARQMDKQGRFIAELKRTRSWHYSNYLMGGAGRLATIGECVGEDLWNHQLDDGRGLQTSIRFLDEYSDKLETWPFKDHDLAAKRLDRMNRIHSIVDTLFARGRRFPPGSELP
ncbi:MAG: alginate lyase family protein [Pseudomonadota bacterium]